MHSPNPHYFASAYRGYAHAVTVGKRHCGHTHRVAERLTYAVAEFVFSLNNGKELCVIRGTNRFNKNLSNAFTDLQEQPEFKHQT